MDSQVGIKRFSYITAALLVFQLLISANYVAAQEGHPLNGTWSGNRIVDGVNTRVLIIFNLLPNQVIEGTLLENGMRVPLEDVTLNPLDWTVAMKASGKDKAGKNFHYEITGALENLGSATERTIVGTWQDGAGSGNFRNSYELNFMGRVDNFLALTLQLSLRLPSR